MENAILEQIRAELSALKERVAEMERQLDEYERLEAEQVASANALAAAGEALTEEASLAETFPAAEEEYSEDQTLEDPILTSPADDAPIDLGIDLPDFGGGVKSINDVQSRKIHKRLMDSASSTPKWKTDLPGTTVRNIISAISLNDRVLMINKLFGEDPQLFQQALSDLNAMGSFADAEDYIHAHFGDWKMDSEPVYRFMMAVRRKLNR